MKNSDLEISAQFFTRVDEVLFHEWDPIGISESDCPRDEYQSYVPQVCKIALEASTIEPVAKHLTRIAVERMGLQSMEEHDIEIAKRIMKIKKELNE